jgi:hypothetical protein
LLVYGLSRQATIWLGLLWGVVVWLGMFLVVLPMAAPGHLSHGGGSVGVMISHMLFGLAVGIGFLPYQRPAPDPLPWWAGHSAAAGHAAR